MDQKTIGMKPRQMSEILRSVLVLFALRDGWALPDELRWTEGAAEHELAFALELLGGAAEGTDCSAWHDRIRGSHADEVERDG